MIICLLGGAVPALAIKITLFTDIETYLQPGNLYDTLPVAQDEPIGPHAETEP